MTRYSLSIKTALVVLLGTVFLGWTPAYGQVAVNLPTVTARVGSTPELPITVSDLTGLGVYSYTFTVSYDENLIRISGVSVTGTLSDVQGARPPEVNMSTPGQITVSYASPTPLSGAGTLLTLHSEYVSRGTSPLSFGSFTFNEGTPASVTTDGSAIVPTLAIYIPTNNAGTMGLNTVVPVGVDNLTGLGVYSYEFTVTYNPAVVNVTGVSFTGTLSEGAGLRYSVNTGAGTITVTAARNAVISGQGILANLLVSPVAPGVSDLDFASFMFNEGTPVGQTINGGITIAANGAPIFGGNPGTITIVENQTFSYTFSASDPEQLPVTLALTTGGGVANVTFDTATGYFRFAPDLTQQGTYTFVVTASDGAITSQSTLTVIVLNVTEEFEASLAGVHEVPFVYTPAGGAVSVILDEGARRLTVDGAFSALASSYSMSHIHSGAVGFNGAPVVTLTVDPVGARGGSFGARSYTVPQSVIDELKAGTLYVNVHTAGNLGEIRGQLLRAGNRAPASADARVPGTVTISGSGADNSFSVTWLPANDPDGDVVNYVLQMSLNGTFTDLVAVERFGTENGFRVTVDEAADLFDTLTDRDPGNIALGGSVSVYFRVITTDGSLWTVGPQHMLTMTRGTVTGTEGVDGLPTEFALSGNYPNPFNPSTTVRFDLPERALVSVTVVDVLGRVVLSTPAQEFSAGSGQSFQVNAGSLPSGTYVYRVLAQGSLRSYSDTGLMTLMK